MISNVLGSRGLSFVERDVLILNSTGEAVTKGDLLQFDTLLTVATNFKQGDIASAWYNVVKPLSGTLLGKAWSFYCIADEDLPIGIEGKAWIQHHSVLCKVDASVTPFVRGLGAGSSVDFALDVTPAVGDKIVALPLASGSGVQKCFFDGYFGLGTNNTV